MELKYDDILNFANLNDFEPHQVVGILGLIFETSREHGKIEDLKIGLDFSEKQNLDNFDDHDKMIFHYNVANGWSYLQILTQEINSDDFWAFKFQELEKQIINLRLALIYSEGLNDDFNKCQILTNLGNLFSQIGRFSEAQLYWHEALEIISDFPMAVGNIGFGIFHYAKALYDTGHQSIFFKFAYKFLTNSLDLDIYDEAKQNFSSLAKDLEERFNNKQLKDLEGLGDYKLGKSKGEQNYRKWCLENKLFLNPINDISIESIAAHDCILLPTMTLNFDQTPVYQTIFNQLKQEFVTARFLLFEGITLKRRHYSDNGNLQMDTLDYATYSFSIEKVKIAFRMCYSILDKIGYLLNDYLDLGFKPEQVSFRKIWYTYKNNKPNGLNPKISDTKNWAFRGLFWLSKDLYEKYDLEFVSSIEPNAKDLALMRNYIEHKSFKTVELGESSIVDNGLTFLISRNEFELKTLKLFKLIRAAMIYLSLGINQEESKKDIDRPTLPVYFIDLKDDYKY